MIKIPIELIEQKLDVNILRNQTSVGVDTASRTGLCFARTTKTYLFLEYSFLDMKSKNENHKLTTLVNHMNEYLQDKTDSKLVIENTFYSRNVKVLQFLSRIGGAVFAVGYLCNIKSKNIMFISAVSSRKKLSLPTNKKKAVVHEAFKTAIPLIKTTDVDIVDAIILAINGLLTTKGLF